MKVIRIEDSSLEVLKQEDLRLKHCFERIDQLIDPSFQRPGYDDRATEVLRRYEYATVVKEVLFCLAVRQSAAMDVAKTISTRSELAPIATEIVQRGTACRSLIHELRVMRRSESSMSLALNTKFEEVLRLLQELASNTIEWELASAIPLIAQSFDSRDAVIPFNSAGYVKRHAPRRLCSWGPQWYESAPVISRLLMFFSRFYDVQI